MKKTTNGRRTSSLAGWRVLLPSLTTLPILVVSMSAANAQGPTGQTWQWQNPRPQGSSLLDVDFVDAASGWAAGIDGTVLRTLDGGASWTIQSQGGVGLPTFMPLFTVDFVDADTGWVGSMGSVSVPSMILRTTDGGETWAPQWSSALEPGITVEDLHFLDADTGWAVGIVPGAPGLVLRTTDGGGSWDDLSSAPGLPQDAGALHAVHFLDADNGWMVGTSGSGSNVFRTEDGGDTWTASSIPTQQSVRDVFFTAPDTGYAVAFGGEIWHTADGGETWTQRPSGTDLPLVSVTFTGPQDGYAAGGLPLGGVLLRTTDAGLTWTAQPMDFLIEGISFAGADTGTVVGANGAVARSADGGETWTPQWSAATRVTLRGVSFPAADVGTAVGDFGTIVRTTDGGATWEPQDSGIGAGLADVQLVAPDRGFAVGDEGTILRTDDGGATWEPQVSGTSALLFAVHFVDAETGWAAGRADTVLHTADGGATWSSRETGMSADWADVFFLDAERGWVAGVGASGVAVLGTTDGGTTWEDRSPDVSGQLTAVHFVDADTGWAVGDSVLLHTADGGDTWTSQLSGGLFLNDVSFTDAAHGFAVGGNLILSTVDGGATWAQELIMVRGGGFRAIVPHDAETATTVGGAGAGQGGFILRRTGDGEPSGGLSLTPDPLDFGEVIVGETAGPSSLTMTNVSEEEVTVGEVTAPELPFVAVGGTCAVPPFALEPEESCTLSYLFRPLSAGPVATAVTVTSDAEGGPHTATLRGTGVLPAPVLSFDPNVLSFGDVEVGTTSPPQTSTLRNTGTAAATELTFVAPGRGFTADTGLCGEVLPVDGSCVVEVTFTPTEPGQAIASLTADSAEGAQGSLRLSGNGVEGDGGFEAAALEADPTVLVSDGNGIFEPGELVEIAPAWRNDGSAPRTLSGTLSDLAGPDGAVYTLALDHAEYGLVASGATASCLDTGVCYWLGVNVPAVRPATHWTVESDETLSDGTARTWRLHVGDSFADVPRSSLFYPAIETLLHAGVSEGCGATRYCPGGLISRAQLAAFLLRAVEGGDYTPPACTVGDAPFLDVPADGAFCPWIAELARRGVVTGCGGGNYCPGGAVTRAQMAIFLLRALEGGGYAPPECTGAFADVTCPSLFADWVEELAARGITAGCSETEYCPAAPVTRAQMAPLVTATFGLRLYEP